MSARYTFGTAGDNPEFILPGTIVIVRWSGTEPGRAARVERCQVLPQHVYRLAKLDGCWMSGIPREWIRVLSTAERELVSDLRLTRGKCFIRGPQVQVARRLETAGGVTLEDCGEMKNPSGRSDGERWWCVLAEGLR